jgi:hypothetical protein
MFSGFSKLSFATHTTKSHSPTISFYKAVTALTGIFVPLLYLLSLSVLLLSHCGPLAIAATRESQIASDFTHHNAALTTDQSRREASKEDRESAPAYGNVVRSGAADMYALVLTL